MTKTYEELEAIDRAEDERDRARVLHILGLLTPDMSGLDILLTASRVGDDAEVNKRWKSSYATEENPYGESTLEILQKMSAKELAAVRARVTQ